MSNNSLRLSNSEFLKEYPKTGPGTLGGRYLRQFWHPLCLSDDLKDVPYPVRILGEDLVAFRLPDGRTGLVQRTCPHRCASLEYAQVREHGLMCSYHGWTFDTDGSCTDMPLEPVNTPLMKQVKVVSYPTEEWGGVVWCFMGPEEASRPPLPRIDILARTDGDLVMARGDVRPYNYLNFMENFADMGHIYVMHMLEPGKVPPELVPYVDTTVDTSWRNIDHKVFETSFGMKCVLVHNTANQDVKYVNTWSLVLPYFYRFGGIAAGLPPDFTNDRRESGGMLRIIDDTHFEMFRFQLIRPGNFRSTYYPVQSDTSRGLSAGLRGTVELKPYDYREHPAWEGLPPVEDYVLQKSQGEVPDRSKEYLGTSDIGVIQLRRIYRRGMEALLSGEVVKVPAVDGDGILRTDTFKGLIAKQDIEIGPKNMPSSEDGRGLIRDGSGNLVFA